MQFEKTVTLKNGQPCLLRTLTGEDAKITLDVFLRTHEQTDYMLTYADESVFTEEGEREFLQKYADSDNGVEMGAFIDGVLVGTGGFECVADHDKTRHRAECGLGIDRAYWGNGVGREILTACIELAKQAGFLQLELDAVAENERAIALYTRLGFCEYGRNPKGMRRRDGSFQELILMRLELQ